MGWITKPSATMKVASRPAPYLSEALKGTIEREVLPRFPNRQAALLPTLHAVQHEHGWLPLQALEEVASFLGLSAASVLDTASFYEEFWLREKGEHVLAVCRSIACEVCDHKSLTDACREKLGIEVGETTPDGRYTLVELECLGACGGAPAMLFDETLHENATPDQVQKLIDSA